MPEIETNTKAKKTNTKAKRAKEKASRPSDLEQILEAIRPILGKIEATIAESDRPPPEDRRPRIVVPSSELAARCTALAAQQRAEAARLTKEHADHEPPPSPMLDLGPLPGFPAPDPDAVAKHREHQKAQSIAAFERMLRSLEDQAQTFEWIAAHLPDGASFTISVEDALRLYELQPARLLRGCC